MPSVANGPRTSVVLNLRETSANSPRNNATVAFEMERLIEVRVE